MQDDGILTAQTSDTQQDRGSALAEFKTEPEDEPLLVEAIQLLISPAATVDSG